MVLTTGRLIWTVKSDLLNHLRRYRTTLARLSKPVLAGLLIAQLFVLSALAVSPRLHQWLHHDAESDSHQCAVTLMAHQQVTPAPANPVLVTAVSGFIFLVPVENPIFIAAFDYTAFPTRAPPNIIS
jgi:hypothetical protein